MTEASIDSKSVHIPKKWAWWITAFAFGGFAYGPGHDFIASKMPVRGEQAAAAAAGRNDADNRRIIDSLAKIESYHADLINGLAAVAALKDTTIELQKDVRELRFQINQIEDRPPRGTEYVPSPDGKWLVPKPAG